MPGTRMKPSARQSALGSLLPALLLAATAIFSSTPRAQEAYPSRQITFVTLTPPGAALDVVARTIAAGLQEQMGQAVVVVNRTGAGGNIGAGEIARSAPDGYTIGMITSATHGINPSFMPSMPFDPIKDFAPITLAAELNILLCVRADFPAKSLKELINYAKPRPGTLSFGSAGAGTALHMVGELAKARTGLDMTHVPYQGVAKSLPDLLGGQLHVLLANPADVVALVQDNRVRALAVASAVRDATLPDVPTFAEQGFPDVRGATWFGVAGPAGLPPSVTSRLNKEIQEAMRKPAAAARLAQLGMNVTTNQPAEFQAFIAAEIAKWTPLASAAKAAAR